MAGPTNGIDPARVTDIVADVLARLPQPSTGVARPVTVVNSERRPPVETAVDAGADGIFTNVDEAVAAAAKAQQALVRLSLRQRNDAIECIRRICREQAEELGRLEFEETQIGRLDHKIAKLPLVATVPGVEMLRTEAVSGDRGLTVTEFAPFGVIAAITPVTHSIPTLASNAIMMIAAGNTVVCNPHPGGARCLNEAARRWNRAMHAAVGIDNLICVIDQPTLETADALFHHRGVALLCVTGGPGLAKAAFAAPKKAIVAGPGNPPVVVDESADIEKAAAGIVAGCAFDNNLLCISEKEVFVVAEAADALLAALGRHGGYCLSSAQMDRLAETCIRRNPDTGHYYTTKEYLGKDPAVIAAAIGVQLPVGVEILYGETAETNPLVPCEQMMPVLPVVRVRDVDDAIAKAVHHEHGFKHTAIMWSRNVENLTRMGRECAATLYVKNGPCMAGLGAGGEGYTSFSTASPTGEGVTNPLTFTRYRRCVMVDSLRVI